MSLFPLVAKEIPLPRPTASEPAAQAHPASLSSIIHRIEDAVELETAAIRTNADFDLPASNARKSRYLYELNRAASGLSPQHLSDEHRDGLQRLRKKLEVNEQAILAHLNAVKEVAGLLQSAIQRAETDGTYSAHQFSRD